MILVAAPLLFGLLILAGYGVYVLVNGLFNPWHLWIVALELAGFLLLFRLLWVWIGNRRRP